MAVLGRGIHNTKGAIQANYADDSRRSRELEVLMQGFQRENELRESKYSTLLLQTRQHAAQLAASYQQRTTIPVVRNRNVNDTFAGGSYGPPSSSLKVQQPQTMLTQKINKPQQQQQQLYAVNRRTTGGGGCAKKRVPFQHPIINNTSTSGQNQHRRASKVPTRRPHQSQISMQKHQRRLRKIQGGTSEDNVDGYNNDGDLEQQQGDEDYDDDYYYSSTGEDESDFEDEWEDDKPQPQRRIANGRRQQSMSLAPLNTPREQFDRINK